MEKSMKLLILDGNSVINRAFFGVKPLTTREGLYTHAIFGFLNILERMQKEEQPDAVCVSFDLHGPTFRHEMYDGYKATRHGMPEELAQQMPIMKDVLRAMNIPIYECQGWEADDVIGTVSRICSNNDWACVVATGDRDSLQLIDKNVHVKLVISKPGQTTTTLYDEEKFREAAANWVSGEKAKFRAKEKNTYFTLIGLLIFGSIMLVLCLSLQKNIYELQYSLMPIMGSLALSKATGILVIDIPVIHAQRWILNDMNKYNVIKFEYGSDHNDLSCEADQGRQEPEKE
jgi:hypothetical protein